MTMVTALMGRRSPLMGTGQMSLTHLVSKGSEIPIRAKGRAKHSPAALGKGTPVLHAAGGGEGAPLP